MTVMTVTTARMYVEVAKFLMYYVIYKQSDACEVTGWNLGTVSHELT